MEFKKYTRDRYFSDDEVADMFDRITRPLEGPEIEPETMESKPQLDNSISRQEFSSCMVGLMDLMRQLVESVKAQPAPTVVVNPTVEARLLPHERVTTVHRDQMGRIVESHSKID